MAKKSKIAKAKKQKAMIAKYAPIRQALKEAGDYEGLSKLPKDDTKNSLSNKLGININGPIVRKINISSKYKIYIPFIFFSVLFGFSI